jgi:hypothetical protein
MQREYVSCLEDRARVLPELGASNQGMEPIAYSLHFTAASGGA